MREGKGTRFPCVIRGLPFPSCTNKTIYKQFFQQQQQKRRLQITTIHTSFTPYNTLMQLQTQFKLTTAHVRQRLISIIDFRLQQITTQHHKPQLQLLVLNQALLQEWYELLQKLVYMKDVKKIPTKPTKVNHQNRASQRTLSQIKPIPPLHRPSNNTLLNLDTNHVDLYQIQQYQERGQYKFKSSITKLQFKRGFVHRFCSYNFINEEEVVFIGGCEDNSALKSADICSFNLKTTQIAKLGELPYGISSHGSVKIRQKIYIVGGNIDPNMVTKKCLCFDLQLNKCQPIDELHYPSASHCLLAWNDKFIYKFGGIGSCFGQWDLSPYIQRYSIDQNSWEIVNPTIRINQNLIEHYSLLVNSIAYVSSRSSIVVLGGFDLKQESSRKMFEIAVREQEGGQATHQIVTFGELQQLQAGGFMPQEPLFLHGQLLAIQTQTGNRQIVHKLVKISNSVQYL